MRAIVIGAGHNGLVCAAYLARAGLSVTVLERRAQLGGACVTEELWPGYRVSRAAYVVSLFRPRIALELELERHGLVLLPRRPSSATPLRDGRSLVLGFDRDANKKELERFSRRDAEAYERYERWLGRVAAALEPTLDVSPPERLPRRPAELFSWWHVVRAALGLRRELPQAARLLLGSASDLLCEWFESEPLRATLATDAVIGAFAPPSAPGTGYVLFHHMMGSLAGERGVWAYVRGGMGGLSQALAASARAHGAEIRTRAPVTAIRMRAGRVLGVALGNGAELDADLVISGADLERTFALLEQPTALPEGFRRALETIDYRSPVVKINLALREPPEFRTRDRERLPLEGTIHVGCETLADLEAAFEAARGGAIPERPMVELVIPSILDDSLAPPGRHVASIFAQYAPALAMDDAAWPELRDRMRDRSIALVEELAPGFADSIEQVEVLAPPDLEEIFGLTGGNIFHGAMSPDRLLFLRPLPGWSRYRTPIPNLFLCGAGTHPGGGVLGAPGRNAAREITRQLRRL